MKAAVCRAFNQPLVVEELTLAPPLIGEARVAIKACAVCHSDIHAIEGAWEGVLPVVYGHEAAGVVVAIGPGVESVSVGDHVVVGLIRSCGRCFYCSRNQQYLCAGDFALKQSSRLRDHFGAAVAQGINTGAFAEQVVVDQSQLVKIPPQLQFPSAALLTCGVITGFGAVVNTAEVSPGSSVVVIGVGGVGLNSVQGAVAVGADPIIAIDFSDRKLSAARDFGATHTIRSAGAGIVQQVLDLTQNRKADYVFVVAGSTKAIEQGLSLTRNGGALVVVGMPAKGAMAQFEMVEIPDRGQRIIGSKMGSAVLQRDIPMLIQRYQRGLLKLDELVSAHYSLEQINAAITDVKQGRVLRAVICFDRSAGGSEPQRASSQS